jgi:hypothetical protein
MSIGSDAHRMEVSIRQRAGFGIFCGLRGGHILSSLSQSMSLSDARKGGEVRDQLFIGRCHLKI